MWILSSLGRPDRIRKVVDCYLWGQHSQVVLALWGGDPRLREYLHSDWPECWRVEIVKPRGNGATYNEILRRYPNEPQYGFLADDAVLDVQGMLRGLEDAAGAWNVAYPNDGIQGERLCTMPCIGGNLVRAAGYLAPPHLQHWAIDNVWQEVGRATGGLRYHPEFSYTHMHPLVGRAPWDKTYLEAQNSSFGWQDILRSFVVNGELSRIVKAAEGIKAVA